MSAKICRMMKARWKIFVEAKTEQKADKVIQKFFDQLSLDHTDLEISAYHKGGFAASFTSTLPVENWAETVVITLHEAQHVGRNWILSGDITQELDAWSNDARISGIKSMQLVLERP